MSTFFVFVFLGLCLVLVILSVKFVPQGMEYTVQRFGKHTATPRPGLNVIFPISDCIGGKRNVLEGGVT